MRVAQVGTSLFDWGGIERYVVKFAELCSVFGEDFHESGRYPEVERILAQETDGAVKVEELCEAAERDFVEAS